MSLNFSDLGGLDKEIRCLIVQSFNKKIKLYYDDFEEVKEKFGSKVVTVYEPDSEQKNMILDLLIQSLGKDDENKDEIKIDGADFLVKLISELTDIELNLSYDNEKDRKQIEKILNKPSKILFAVHNEIRAICNEVFDMLYESMVNLSERPEGIRDALLMRFKENGEVEVAEDIQEVENDVESIPQEEKENE